MENPRETLCGKLPARPTPIVRGSSRRIMIVRCRPANIRMINRRDSRFDCYRLCISKEEDERDNAGLTGSFHISVLSFIATNRLR
jgi:hypothetical protein